MTQKVRLKNLEDFGFGPNVMKKTKVCARCGKMVKANAKTCPDCGESYPAKRFSTATNSSTRAASIAIRCFQPIRSIARTAESRFYKKQ